MAHSSAGPSVAAPAMIEDPLVSAAYGISCWQSAAEAKVPEDAHEYYIRQSLNDSAYRTLAYTPYCACYPTCVKCERPQFMWKRKAVHPKGEAPAFYGNSQTATPSIQAIGYKHDDASWSAQFQLAARELMRGEFTLSLDMVLGAKALVVKWIE
ncbi:hypothetical protein QJQ45_025529, partial [Haematococcus lacustris]